MSIVVHEREQTDVDIDRYSKRTKLDQSVQESVDDDSVLPPSHNLLGVPPPKNENGRVQFLEQHVGISEYIGRGVSSIQGTIKQRCVCSLQLASFTIPTD
jgi:tRNA pseudouridine13 synthase